MSHEDRKYVPILIDKPRRLRLTWNAIATFAREIGKPIDWYFGQIALVVDPEFRLSKIQLMEIVTPDVLIAMLWVALLHDDKTLTREQVGDLLEESGKDFSSQYDYVFEKIRDAWVATQPEGIGIKKKTDEETRLRKLAEETVLPKNSQSPDGTISESISSEPQSMTSRSMSSGR